MFENLTLEKNLKMTVVSVNRGQLCVKLFDNDEDIVPTMMKLYYQRIEPHRNDDNGKLIDERIVLVERMRVFVLRLTISICKELPCKLDC